MSDELKHVESPFVIGLGDEVQILVWRSEVLAKSDERYAPIKAHIDRFDMQLFEEVLKPKDEYLYGRVYQSWFCVPTARNLLMAYPEDAESNALVDSSGFHCFDIWLTTDCVDGGN